VTANRQWRDLLKELATDCVLTDGMPFLQYRELQETFGHELHPELRALLEATNGVRSPYDYALLWPIERIIDENRRIRCDRRLLKQYMPLDCLFFFADAGNGDLFGHAVVDNEIRCSDVFLWSHEDDSRTVYSTTLRGFLDQLLKPLAQ